MTKTKITVGEFNKKVEIEAAHLMYFEYMKQDKAFAKARETVSAKFEIA
jgi:hypothetical protein